MATVTREMRGNWHDTDRRVRHPLHAVRGWIRQYVVLEGLGLTLLYLLLAFWLGFGFDWGLFQALSFDWVQVLQGMTRDSGVDLYVRGLVLTLVVLGLAAVAVTKTLMRLFHEFSDHAMALLLERRFPRELGDRLITAVELADPRISEKYGFSLALTEKTIRDAAERVERLPVRGVFNWARLRWIWLMCLAASLGIFVVAGTAVCIVDQSLPQDFALRFCDDAAIWTDRNILLQDIHWPRQAYLEVLGFQGTADDPNEMNIGSGETRDQLHVRAFRWMKMATSRYSDKGWVPVPGGWTPLMWEDLDQFFTADELGAAAIRSDWNGWMLDAYDAGGNWHDWTVDQVWRQFENKKVREKMDVDCGSARSALETIFERLQQLADEPGMGRRIRALNIPETVRVAGRNKQGPISAAYTSGDYNRFGIGFRSVPSTTTFVVRALDYTTPPRTISVIPPPSLASFTVDKHEPAYVYYRVRGADQTPLRGVKHVIEAEPLALTGISMVKVASGSDVVLRGELAEVDQGRRLREVTVREVREEERLEGEADNKNIALVPRFQPRFRSDDATGFILTLTNVVSNYDFVIEFRDRFNAVEKRRVRVEVLPDEAPEALVEIEQEKQMRRPKMRGDTNRPLPQSVADAWIITPDAVLPLRGRVRDDYGLTDANYIVRVELTDVEFSGNDLKDLKKDKDAAARLLGKDEAAKLQNVTLQMPLRKYLPRYRTWEDSLNWVTLEQIDELNQAEHQSVEMMEFIRQSKYDEARPTAERLLTLRMEALGPNHVDVARSRMILAEVLEGQARAVRPEGAPPFDAKKALDDALRNKDLAKNIDRLPRSALVAWEKSSEDDFRLLNVRNLIDKQRSEYEKRGDVRALTLPRFKDPDQPQLHYMLYLNISATDNNLEKGPITTISKTPLKFIVVSENEFLFQIAEEEGILAERLEKAGNNLKSAHDKLQDACDRLAGKPSYEDIRSRVSLAQTYLNDASAATREISREYERIKNHLYFNQARGAEDKGFGPVADKYGKVVDLISTPLENLVEGQPEKDAFGRPNLLYQDKGKKLASVDFPTTEVFLKRLLEAVKNETGPVPSASIGRHLEEISDARVRAERVMNEVNRILNVITTVVTKTKLRDMIQKITKEEEGRYRVLREHYERIVREELRKLEKELKDLEK